MMRRWSKNRRNMTNAHGSYLAIGCWCVSCLSDGEIEEGKQTEDIGEEGV